MNKGTARKLAALFEAETRPLLRGSQLRIGDAVDPCAVLADLLDPDGWKPGWDGMSWEWRGEQFYLRQRELLQRSKIRSAPEELAAFFECCPDWDTATEALAWCYRVL